MRPKAIPVCSVWPRPAKRLDSHDLDPSARPLGPPGSLQQLSTIRKLAEDALPSCTQVIDQSVRQDRPENTASDRTTRQIELHSL